MPQIQGNFLPPNASRYVSQAPEEVIIVKTSPGILYNACIVNVGEQSLVVWFFDSPNASGAALHSPIRIPAGGSVSFSPSEAFPFETGLTLAASASARGYAAWGMSDIMATVIFR